MPIFGRASGVQPIAGCFANNYEARAIVCIIIAPVYLLPCMHHEDFHGEKQLFDE
jgi:hypothetical protein